MSESTNQLEPITNFVEKSLDYPGIRFEPGIHSSTVDEADELVNNFTEGNLNVHGWNKEVLERMRKYSPEVVAIDGGVPLSSRGEIMTPEFLWVSLPGKPSEINPTTKEVYVVRGDLMHYDYLFSRMGAESVGKSLEEQDDKRYSAIALSGEGGAKDILSWLGSGAILDRSFSETKISRRNFLRLTGAAVGAATIVHFFRPLLVYSASKSQNSETKDFFVDLYNILEKTLIKKNVIDFRTSLLIAKEEDAIDFLDKPKSTSGTVLMGNSHSRRVSELMSNKNERLKTISSFTEVLVGSLDQALKKHSSVFSREELRNTLLNFISAVEVIKLTDPPINPDGSFGPLTMVTLGTFQSPQVEDAISKFR